MLIQNIEAWRHGVVDQTPCSSFNRGKIISKSTLLNACLRFVKGRNITALDVSQIPCNLFHWGHVPDQVNHTWATMRQKNNNIKSKIENRCDHISTSAPDSIKRWNWGCKVYKTKQMCVYLFSFGTRLNNV